MRELITILQSWGPLDNWIVVTAALAAMACAVPGVFLVMRRQSMMGDALSHTALPGIVLAFLLAHYLLKFGWISSELYNGWRHAALFLGAMLIGVLSAVLTELVQKLGRVEASAALGVVFTTLFAAGLLLIRLAADQVHIDPDCVLYGTVETAVMDTLGGTGVPRAAIVNGCVLAVNLVLVALFFKELRLSAFDPALATSMGIPAHAIHYALMAVTAATLVAAFETVGSILVIAMLIAPAATAHLLTDRLGTLIAIAVAVAGLSAALGHLLAITLPPLIFGWLGFPSVVDASTAGMMAVAAGLLFVLAALFGPRHGVVSKVVQQTRLGLRIAAEDILGLLYRREETATATATAEAAESAAALAPAVGPLVARWALARLSRRGEVVRRGARYQLTESGRRKAEQLVRAHRLWESYMAKHFELPDDHLHETAEQVEHYLDPELRERLADELSTPTRDPHGRKIPTGQTPSDPSHPSNSTGASEGSA